jgi:hypothetical protein
MGHTMTKCVLEIPQIPHNLFDPSAQIGQLFVIFLKKITCALSMVFGIENQIRAFYYKMEVID